MALLLHLSPEDYTTAHVDERGVSVELVDTALDDLFRQAQRLVVRREKVGRARLAAMSVSELQDLVDREGPADPLVREEIVRRGQDLARILRPVLDAMQSVGLLPADEARQAAR